MTTFNKQKPMETSGIFKLNQMNRTMNIAFCTYFSLIDMKTSFFQDEVSPRSSCTLMNSPRYNLRALLNLKKILHFQVSLIVKRKQTKSSLKMKMLIKLMILITSITNYNYKIAFKKSKIKKNKAHINLMKQKQNFKKSQNKKAKFI